MKRATGRDDRVTRELIHRAQTGDRAAFERLIEKHRSRLAALIHVRLGQCLRREVDAEDVLQEALLRAWEAVPRFRWCGKGSFFRWVGGIVDHILQDLVRKLKRAGSRLPATDVECRAARTNGERGVVGVLVASGPSPSKAFLRAERFERLAIGLASLSDDHREVIILARIRCLPMAEIAECMGRSADAVSMLLLRALRQLRVRLDETGSLCLPPQSLDPDVSARGAASDGDGDGRDGSLPLVVGT